MSAIWRLGNALSKSRAFRNHAATVRAAPDPSAASVEISSKFYVPRACHGRRVMAHYLLIGASTQPDPWWTCDLINAAGGGYLPDGELADGQPRRAMYPGQDVLLNEGVVLLVRRGAVRCLECDDLLEDRYRMNLSGPRPRRAWRDYCDRCDGTRSASRHKEAIRLVLDSAAPIILGVESRRRRWRERRRDRAA